MEIRQLKYFIQAAKYLNFTRAAHECGIVQTAMTQQIANLEGEVGTPLFRRSTRGLTLTAAGERFLKDAKTIVSQAERSLEQMQGFIQHYTRTLRIAFHGELMKQDLVEILKEYRRREPDTMVFLSQQSQKSLLENLEIGDADAAFSLFIPEYNALPWLKNEILETDCLMLAISLDHPLAARSEITMKELEQVPLVYFREKANEDRFFVMAQTGTTPNTYGYLQDHTSIELLVESGYAASIWASRLCRPESYPQLAFLKIVDHPGSEQVCLSWRDGNENPALAPFVQLVKEHFSSDQRQY